MMSGPMTVVFIPGDVDLQAGLAALDAVEDHVLLERAHLGLLGWGWSIPPVGAPEPPWADDEELTVAALAGSIPDELQQRYLAAVRESLSAGIRNAATLLAGEHTWFESRVARRLPLASGGEMVVFAEVADGSDGATLSDVARLPVEVLPEIGRVMGVLGPEAVSIHVAVTAAV
jgi:hypothetical protein